MISRSKKVLLIGAVTVALMLLFPPWDYFDNDSSGRGFAGHHFFLSPPRLKSSKEMFGHEVRFPEIVRVLVDDVRLVMELIITVPTFLGLTLLLRTKRSVLGTALGILLIAFALFVVGFNVWITVSERLDYGHWEFLV